MHVNSTANHLPNQWWAVENKLLFLCLGSMNGNLSSQTDRRLLIWFPFNHRITCWCSHPSIPYSVCRESHDHWWCIFHYPMTVNIKLKRNLYDLWTVTVSHFNHQTRTKTMHPQSFHARLTLSCCSQLKKKKV